MVHCVNDVHRVLKNYIFQQTWFRFSDYYHYFEHNYTGLLILNDAWSIVIERKKNEKETKFQTHIATFKLYKIETVTCYVSLSNARRI